MTGIVEQRGMLGVLNIQNGRDAGMGGSWYAAGTILSVLNIQNGRDVGMWELVCGDWRRGSVEGDISCTKY